MEIQAQDESKGILYEGYADAFKQCIFEDGAIQGRNERYEFRFVVFFKNFIFKQNLFLFVSFNLIQG